MSYGTWSEGCAEDAQFVTTVCRVVPAATPTTAPSTGACTPVRRCHSRGFHADICLHSESRMTAELGKATVLIPTGRSLGCSRAVT